MIIVCGLDLAGETELVELVLRHVGEMEDEFKLAVGEGLGDKTDLELVFFIEEIFFFKGTTTKTEVLDFIGEEIGIF